MSVEPSPVPGPRTVAEWYRDARRVLFHCEAEADRLAQDETPLDREHLLAVVRLSQQLVDLFEPLER